MRASSTHGTHQQKVAPPGWGRSPCTPPRKNPGGEPIPGPSPTRGRSCPVATAKKLQKNPGKRVKIKIMTHQKRRIKPCFVNMFDQKRLCASCGSNKITRSDANLQKWYIKNMLTPLDFSSKIRCCPSLHHQRS